MSCNCKNCYYNIQCATYYTSKYVEVDPNCNTWTAVNAGNDPVTVNNIPLKPYPPGHPELDGGSYTAPVNLGEKYRGKLQVSFAGTGSAPQVLIIQKIYVEG